MEVALNDSSMNRGWADRRGKNIRDRRKDTIRHLLIASDFLVISKADWSKKKLQGTYFGIKSSEADPVCLFLLTNQKK